MAYAKDEATLDISKLLVGSPLSLLARPVRTFPFLIPAGSLSRMVAKTVFALVLFWNFVDVSTQGPG